MQAEYIKVKGKLTADSFGCSESYFKKFIKGKPLQIIHSTPSHYVRVTDQNQEEWGLFHYQYTVVTGLEDAPATEESQAEKTQLLRQETG